jgi:putative transposase
MPHGLKRYYGAGDFHFITASCYQRKPLLNTPERRDLFLQVLENTRRKYRFLVLGYVVMPEHFHLLISEPREGTPSVVVQALKIGFVRRLLSGREHSGARIWQRRFYDFNVWTPKKRIEKLRYIHRNPVTRRLVPAPEEWGWSSFRSYAYGETGPVRINDWEILEMKVSAVS